MKTNPNDAACPSVFDYELLPKTATVETGLTKREYFAAAALQALANGWSYEHPDLAKKSVQLADELIIALNAPTATASPTFNDPFADGF